ncbi:conserved protein of unknown function [Rhodovastum atsumiense]|uniref:Uncharacterized protein n=1 Tax=Rhodovastum atsumiense TaxID=504468 RepID=A0A5M6J028_9PROT|nr:hypothetical protein [Rhodovastum atsumiense]KAA5613913.1 hypothetical protein F1189_03820 [Rhodovastum atsumiense]CAH2602043.1 conserved protein of unknown function [Rhodovastum atsumiense]
MFSATMLNAEAGSHAVVSDPRELAASQHAVDGCWLRFPYLAARFGERGLRFSHSDSAWLATLIRLDQARVHEQVAWLRDVLATRGIPSVILQAHLDILADELDAAVPTERDLHARLRQAAAALQEARQRRIPPAREAAMEEQFAREADPAWRARLPDTPSLLVAAMADECDGRIGAVASLEGWLTDPARFPPGWTAAVAAALTQARAAMVQPGPA